MKCYSVSIMASFSSHHVLSKMPTDTPFAILKVAFDPAFVDATLMDLYQKHINAHNAEMINNPFPNSGFDLFVWKNVEFQNYHKTVFVDHGLKTEMIYYSPVLKKFEPAAYHLVPRSSMSKTPLMMANHMGIIDSGYRGNLLAPVRFLPGYDPPPFVLKSETRLFQICHPSLCRIYVMVVDTEDLTNSTRGVGGFGSTGV